MILAKISFRNVKKSIRDYTVYFLTLSFGVCIFYLFNSLESQQALMSVTKSQAAVFQELGKIMAAISVFVSIILGFLIVYANQFLVKRRKKEFGIYMTLGMDKGKISSILIMETMFVGILSLVAGLALGILLSQAMAVVTAKLIQVSITRFAFIFSAAAALKTMLYFGIIFILLLVFNTVTVSKQRLINLLQANRKNEWFKTPSLPLSVVIFLLALGCLGAAYGKILSGNAAGLLGSGSLYYIALLSVGGTVLFFFSVSGFFLKLLQQSKSLYLRNLNMFVLRQINSKINTAYISMTMVCMMLFISICTLSSGLSFSANIAEGLRESSPFDVTFSVFSQGDENGERKVVYPGYDLVGAAGKSGVDLSVFAREYLAVRYYDAGLSVPLTVTVNNFEETLDFKSYLLKLSDYNAVMALEGRDPITLGADEYAVNSAVTNTSVRGAVVGYMKNADIITLRGVALKTDLSRFYTHTLEVLKNQDYNLTFVVRDELTEGLPVFRDVLHINYLGRTGEDEKMCLESLAKMNFGAGTATAVQTKTGVMELSNSATTIVSYLAVYLGIIFLIAAAAVLAIGQLSETSDNISRYGLLRKIGADSQMLNRALFVQILIYFGAPALLALVHAAVGIVAASRLISAFDQGNILGSALFTAAVLLVIYGGYFLATYTGGKNMLNRDYARDY